MRKASARVVWLAAMAGLFGLGSTGGCSNGHEGTRADGAAPVVATFVVGSKGATVSTPGKEVTLDVPKGALSTDTTITVEEVAPPAAGPVSKVYEIGPTGTRFAVPVTLPIAFDSASLGKRSAQALRIATFANGAWTALEGSTVDASKHVVSGRTTHLSPYADVVVAGGAADGGIEDASVGPDGAPTKTPSPDASTVRDSGVSVPVRDSSVSVPVRDGSATDPSDDAGAIRQFESCAGLAPTCGANGDEDCCASPVVPGGSFDRLKITNEIPGWTNTDPFPATVSTFRLDKFEVSVSRFRKFTESGFVPAPGSGRHTHLNGGRGLANAATGDGEAAFESGWQSEWDEFVPHTPEAWLADMTVCSGAHAPFIQPAGYDSFPVGCIRWQQAYAFCIWDGGFLPSEAEWAYAATGGNEQRSYPWGNEKPQAHPWGNPGDPPDVMPDTFACLYRSTGSHFATEYYPDGGSAPFLVYHCDSVDNFSIAPVGFPAESQGRWGQANLGGNLREWTLDWWNEGTVYSRYPTVECNDCAYVPESPPDWLGRVYRTRHGGDFDSDLSYTIGRDYGEPDVRLSILGFRCARSP